MLEQSEKQRRIEQLKRELAELEGLPVTTATIPQQSSGDTQQNIPQPTAAHQQTQATQPTPKAQQTAQPAVQQKKPHKELSEQEKLQREYEKYNKMELNTLKAVVKNFLEAKGVYQQPVDIGIVERKFGKQATDLLIRKSYLMKFKQKGKIVVTMSLF